MTKPTISYPRAKLGLPMESDTVESVKCPHCKKEINPAAMLGSISTKKKAAASKANGKKGGRPRKQTIGAVLDKAFAPKSKPKKTKL